MTASSDDAHEWLTNNWTVAGRFVRDVTHDVNNQLGAVLAYAELLTLDEERNEGLRLTVDEIASSVQRASLLLDTLAALPGTDLSTVQSVDLCTSIREVLMLFERSVDRSRVRLAVTLPDEAASVQAVHTRIIRLLVHSIRFVFDGVADSPEPRDLRIEFIANADEYVLRIAGKSRTGAAAELSEAVEHAKHHGGTLSVQPDRVTISIPRSTGLE